MRDPALRLEELCAAVESRQRIKWLFFWGHESPAGGVTRACLSQWYPSVFEVDGVSYPTAEHWMMAEKARLFGDAGALQRILAAPHPGAAKAIGREVRAFDEAAWSAARYGIVVRGNLAKFSAADSLREFLLGSHQRVLVEASPLDYVWGIGLAGEDERARQPSLWRGSNLLGFALMEVRERLS